MTPWRIKSVLGASAMNQRTTSTVSVSVHSGTFVKLIGSLMKHRNIWTLVNGVRWTLVADLSSRSIFLVIDLTFYTLGPESFLRTKQRTIAAHFGRFFIRILILSTKSILPVLLEKYKVNFGKFFIRILISSTKSILQVLLKSTRWTLEDFLLEYLFFPLKIFFKYYWKTTW